MAGDLDNASYFAYFELAGIWQPIEVFATSPTYLSHLAVTTDFDKDYRDAKLCRRIGRRQRAGGEGAIYSYPTRRLSSIRRARK